MTSFRKQVRALQVAVAIAAIVPVLIGLWGVIDGFGAPGAFADSQYRFLSGILLGIGLMFWFIVPDIVRRRWPFRILCALVVLGGMARAGAALGSGFGEGMRFALIMELIVTPLLFIWRERLDGAAAAQVIASPVEDIIEPAEEAPASGAGPWG